MRRFERRRFERRRRIVGVVGLSFALGALVDASLAWRLRDRAEAGNTPVAGAPVDDHPAAAPLMSPSAEPAAPAPQPPRVEPASPLRGAVDRLRDRALVIPVDGVEAEDLHDSFLDRRALGRRHHAMDIMAPRHTPVRAADDGTVVKLLTSRGGGGLTIYQFDPDGAFCYYYAHLDRYAAGVREGQRVRRGEVIGYVGSTGNASADAPHLHFAIYQLTPERRWWDGEPLNPFDVLR